MTTPFFSTRSFRAAMLTFMLIAGLSTTAVVAHSDHDDDRDQRSNRHGDRHGDRGDHDDKDVIYERSEHMLDWIIDELDLTQEQAKQVADIFEESFEKIESHHEAAFNQAEAAFTAPALTPAQATTLLELHKTTQEKVQAQMAQAFAKFHAVLTPEQREDAADMILEMQEDRHGGRMRGFGRRSHRGFRWH